MFRLLDEVSIVSMSIRLSRRRIVGMLALTGSGHHEIYYFQNVTRKSDIITKNDYLLRPVSGTARNSTTRIEKNPH